MSFVLIMVRGSHIAQARLRKHSLGQQNAVSLVCAFCEMIYLATLPGPSTAALQAFPLTSPIAGMAGVRSLVPC